MRCGSSFISNALVPNLYGAKAAWAQGIKEVTFVISASEEHNKANVNCSISDSLKELEKIRYEIPNLNIKLDIATAFGCPYVGEVAFSNISKIVDEVAGLGIHEICLCDTIGCANPMQVKNILKPLLSQYNHRRFSVHFHDTRGMGLVNSFTALQYGIMSFESSVGGMGGCPFAPGASGNVATEDLVNMFESMGVKTGIDYMKLTKAVKIVEDLGVDLTSHMALVDGEKTT
jgi:hydroxymethylglutaryl-CoA lyase